MAKIEKAGGAGGPLRDRSWWNGGNAGFIRSGSCSASWVTSQNLSFLIWEMEELFSWVVLMTQFINEALFMQMICKKALQESDIIFTMKKVLGLGRGDSKEMGIK